MSVRSVQEQIDQKSDSSLRGQIVNTLHKARQGSGLMDHDTITLTSGENSIDLKVSALFKAIAQAAFDKRRDGCRQTATDTFLKRIDRMEKQLTKLEKAADDET